MFRSASCCYNIVTAMNQTSRAEKRKEKQKMYTVTFSNEELFIPYIKSKYNEVNQNERKAENRCT